MWQMKPPPLRNLSRESPNSMALLPAASAAYSRKFDHSLPSFRPGIPRFSSAQKIAKIVAMAPKRKI
uniref:Uncharacterized protein n=1 Tax=Nelumbo nucifera TaxID=4432 RepID=A0A822YZZ6_NELNU|nr:TPA_asm: hypothetical protein HUJ06_005428 [Nelumbo nucifera]